MNLTCHHTWLHCTDAMCCLLFKFLFRCYFNSPVDHELGGGHQYIDDQFPYPAEEGKRSPTSLILVFKVFYLHAIQIYFAAPIVACGNCLDSFPLTLAWLVLACCALLELFLLCMLSCYLYGWGIIPGGKYWFRKCWRWNGAANGDNENMIWKESEACMEGHLVCGD